MKTNQCLDGVKSFYLITAAEMFLFSFICAFEEFSPCLAVTISKATQAASPFSLCIQTEALSVFPLLRLAQQTRGCDFATLILYLFSGAHSTLVSCLAPDMSFRTAFTSGNFLEGVAPLILSLKRCKPKEIGPLFLDQVGLLHLTPMHRLLSCTPRRFAAITASRLISTNFHRGSLSALCSYSNNPVILTEATQLVGEEPAHESSSQLLILACICIKVT